MQPVAAVMFSRSWLGRGLPVRREGTLRSGKGLHMRTDGQKSNRGFASMDQAKQREIASKGGQSVPPEKRSFSQDPHLAASAGRKGGEAVPPEGRSFSQNRELAAEAGRKGGLARGSSFRDRHANQERHDEGEDHGQDH